MRVLVGVVVFFAVWFIGCALFDFFLKRKDIPFQYVMSYGYIVGMIGFTFMTLINNA